ncbi:MAG: hypothetical protein PHT40_02540 [Patescibacteria group bacterium]|nr:hypothetical protein [Patescibacteria group bacterium]
MLLLKGHRKISLNGWRLERWYQLSRVYTIPGNIDSNPGGEEHVDSFGYFPYEKTARIYYKKEGLRIGRGYRISIMPIIVLTKDGISGYILDTGNCIKIHTP